MDQEFLVEVDSSRGRGFCDVVWTPSAKVVSTAQRARSLQINWSSYPSREDVHRRLDTFAQLNSLPPHCVQALEQLNEEQLRWMMDQEFLIDLPARGIEKKVLALMTKAKELPVGGAAVASMLDE